MIKHPALVYIANSVSPSASPDPLLERYYLQGVARWLLSGKLARDGRGFRVCDCHRKVVPMKQTVDLLANSHGKVHYSNLMTCDSVWSCAVCASKITERRRLELQQIIDLSGRFKLLITYTLSHHKSDSLEEMLNILLGSFRSTFQGKAWSQKRAQLGWHAHVRTTEITHGVNGWHPHIHLLAFFDNPLDAQQVSDLQNWLKDRWVSTLLPDVLISDEPHLWKHGLRVDGTDAKIAEYVAKFGRMPSENTLQTYSKWTESHEMTKAPVKRGKYAGRTPFQLLQDYDLGDKQAGELFIEYAKVLKGRRQLEYSRSPDIRKELGIAVKTDEELAQEIEDTAYLFASLDRDQWRKVLGNDLRGEVLKAAAAALQASDVALFHNFIAAL